jgi:cytochrome o ubiquinol oxidase subunit 2
MSKKQKIGAMAVLVASLLAALAWHISQTGVAVLQPRGTVGRGESRLIIIAALLSLIVVIPVYIMLFGFAWKYRESNKKAAYEPAFDRSRLFESIWWGVPLALITILGIMTWNSSHSLDPFRPLNSRVQPLTIQVVALQWKWLFIYPEQGVASVNYVQLPLNRPIDFEITSDAPMNSFWIPRLGGQIYAMSGMATHLNLEASQAGSYDGVSANISGVGFAGMHFTAKADTQPAFDQWVVSTKAGSRSLTKTAYDNLAKPSLDNHAIVFNSAQIGLFDSVIAKYQAPSYFSPSEAK